MLQQLVLARPVREDSSYKRDDNECYPLSLCASFRILDAIRAGTRSLALAPGQEKAPLRMAIWDVSFGERHIFRARFPCAHTMSKTR